MCLDDFPDDIITRRAGANGAILDSGFLVSFQEFEAYGHGDTMEGARARCAAAIRQNASVFTAYDMRQRLMPHWARKSRLFALGIDPHEARMRSADAWGLWDMRGSWEDKLRAKAHAEFLLILVVAEQNRRIAIGEVTPGDARREAMTAVLDDLDTLRGARLTDGGRSGLRSRIGDLIPG